MNLLTVLFAYLVFTLTSVAQINIAGTVIEDESDEPLAGASVILRNVNGKITDFTTSDINGKFLISSPRIKGYSIDVSMMGYAKHTVNLDSVMLPLTISMKPAPGILKEVVVTADPIREHGDTIVYNVNSFAQVHDRSIGDVLKRMPGIEVSENGKIQYQGEDINRFYIEGSDLLGGKYGIATNGISHDDVGSVEVMENHQPLQVLSGISFSDKAAINLRLKKKAKASWSLNGSTGAGYTGQPEGPVWDGNLFALAVMPGFQSITTFRANNIGEKAHTTDYFASRRGTEINPYVEVSLPDVPDLSRKRTLFNRSAILSSNSLQRMKNGEFKAQIDYSFNCVTAQAAGSTTYFLESGNRVISEKREGNDRSHSVSGNFIYEVNHKSFFINNTLQTHIDWDNIRLAVTGSLSNDQSASLPDYYVGNTFKMIKRFRGKHIVTFNSKNEWESLPQTLDVSTNGTSIKQHIGSHAFYTHESAAYTFSVKGLTISLEGGVKGSLRSLNTDLSYLPEGVTGNTQNSSNINYIALYAVPQFEYWVRRVNLSLNVPVSVEDYNFHKSPARHSEFYLSPSLSLNWKPNNRLSFSLRGDTGRSPMNLNLIHPGYIMTDYRTFNQGVDNLYSTTSQRVSAGFSYKHTRRGAFANGMIIQSWSQIPYTMMQQLYGDYIVYSYCNANGNGKKFMANGNLGKTLYFMRGSVNVNGSFNRTESHLFSENNAIYSVRTGWSVRAKINGTPLEWLSFDYSVSFSNSRLVMNNLKNPRLKGIENSLLLNIMPDAKWEVRIMGEHYRNQLTAGIYKSILLLDAKLVYKLSKRVELSSLLSNLLDKRSYNYTTYSQLSSFESRRWLRGRQLLLSISLRK